MRHAAAQSAGADFKIVFNLLVTEPFGKLLQREIIYRLLQESWDDDAVIKDVEQHVYTDPDRVHEIGFEGSHFQVAGPHLSEPWYCCAVTRRCLDWQRYSS